MKPENLDTTLTDMTGICVGWYWSHIKPLNQMSCQLNWCDIAPEGLLKLPILAAVLILSEANILMG